MSTKSPRVSGLLVSWSWSWSWSRSPSMSFTLPLSVYSFVLVLLLARLITADSIQLNQTTLDTTHSSQKTVKKELKLPLEIPENNSKTTVTSNNAIPNITNTIKINETIQKEPLDKNNNTVNNSTITKQEENADLKAGAKWRGLLVFGSLGLFSFIYLAHKIYRKRSHLRSTDTSFYPNDSGEFKYGVLMSNDEDHMEMANRPLTMNDSDDEETEIFHQEHRKFVANDIFQKSNQNTPMTSSQVQVYSDNPVSELKLPDLNADTSSEDEDLLDLINNKDVLNESVINNSKSGKTVKLDNVFSL